MRRATTALAEHVHSCLPPRASGCARRSAVRRTDQRSRGDPRRCRTPAHDRHPTAAQSAVLGRGAGVVPSRVVALVDNLERKGLIERRRNPRDRRNYALHLTTEGTHVMTEMRGLGSAHEDDICAALDDTQRAQLAALLEAIAAQQCLTPGVHPGYQQRPR
ncbi:MarR family transcriptional regulator [Micromonospora sp. LZ34]